MLHPRRGTILVFAQVSSMKTRRLGSICPWRAFQRARLRATLGRSCSLGRTVFFEAQAFTMNEGPDRPVVHFEAAASKLRHKGAQGEVSLRDSPLKKDGMLTNKNARPVAAHLPCSRASRRLETLRPFHDARWADVQYPSHKAHALARLDPRNSPLAQIH